MDNQLPVVAARAFAEKWLAAGGDEKQETQRFWMELLHSVFAVPNPADVIRFEVPVDLSHQSYIDAHLPATRVVIEQKSAGIDLAKPQRQSDGSMLTPYEQAKRYADNLPFDDRARWIVTCNFREFRIHDMSRRKPAEPAAVVSLEELPEQHHLLAFLVDDQRVRVEREKQVSMQAGELISRIYNALLERCHDQSDPAALQNLNKFCVRLVFCLYAEDAGLFAKDQFLNYLSAAPGPREMRARILNLFSALNRPLDQRDPYDTELLAFPYVNGGLFADDNLLIPMLDDALAALILKEASAGFDWRGISPTIFGGLFESTLNPATRRSGGMHYTSIENIHKVIDPLFLDALKADLHAIVAGSTSANDKRAKLRALQERMASLTFLDPACGSGNFLTETFISLRRLEIQISREINKLDKLGAGQGMLGGDLSTARVSIRQFHGIEINDFAVSVAKTALWIADAQMWLEARQFSDQTVADFLPLQSQDGIREGNALQLDWLEGIPNRHVDYIIGNPPFVGYTYQSTEQKEDMQRLFADCRAGGKLDFVAAWYKVAAGIMQEHPSTRTAFVSTNSITQGEQASTLWKPLMEDTPLHIDFAHRTFKWENETRGTAAVHCVIVGFSCGEEAKPKRLFDSDGSMQEVDEINSYLTAAPCIYVEAVGKPLCDVPPMTSGNRPADGGHLIIEAKDYPAFVKDEPAALPYIKRLMGSEEFINGKERWCLWLAGVSPAVWGKMPLVRDRVAKCRENRLAAPDAGRRKLADTPSLFRETKNPASYVVVPEVSSEKREYIPMGFQGADIICTNLLQIIPDATLYHFGVLTSSMHMAWMRAVAGRLEMRYRYSNKLVYNNFPWPTPSEEQKEQIEACAQAVLDARALYPDCSLADLYDPLTMPTELRKAHRELDAAVERAYGRKFESDAERVAHLFELYRSLTASR